MPSVFISDFKFGMDRTRKRVAGIPGTLWVGKNVVVSRGGDLERARRFVPTYTLPANTFGLGSVGGQLYVFGSAGGVTPPTGVQYQQLASPDASAMTGVLDVKAVSGKLYVIARYASGQTYHFYNGSRVTDWDALAAANTDITSLVNYMAELINADPAVTATPSGSTITLTANVPGTAFTITKSTTNQSGGVADQDITLATVQVNVPTVAEVRATATVTITGGSFTAGLNQIQGITANAVPLMAAAVDWISSNADTASAVAAQINNLASTHHYAAAAVGAVVTITAGPGTGTTPNGFVVAATAGGNATASSTNFLGGITAVVAIAQVTTATFSGGFEVDDIYTLNINSMAYTTTARAAGIGVSGFVFKRRMWAPAGSLWQYSKLNTFDDWHDAGASSGAGFLNVSNETEGSERLVGAGVFQGQGVIFSRRNIRIYDIDTDATNNALSRALDNSGTMAPRSILNFGDTDLIYLDEPGVRSIQARQSTNAPFVNDLGTSISPFVKDYMDTLSRGTLQLACSVVEPREGRFMLAVGAYIFVFSYFPAANISAWTYFDPGFSVSDFARAYNRLYARSGNTVYLYGGNTGTTYPNANELVATVQLPFISTQPPGREMFSGFDMAAQGAWNVLLLPDPNNESAKINIGSNQGKITYAAQNITASARSTHVALEMTCTSAGAASIQNCSLHYGGSEKDD